MFNLEKGDWVYVEGKLEGIRGVIQSINYDFKIKLSDYKRVIEKIDKSVSGDFHFLPHNIVTFDPEALPYKKVLSWFKPCCDEDFVTGIGGEAFPLDDLSKMKIPSHIAQRGLEYFDKSKISYLCLDGNTGHAIVDGTECYEVDFTYRNGQIEQLSCTCLCSDRCKHEYAVMLELKMLLEQIEEYCPLNQNGYFATMPKTLFLTMIGSSPTGKIHL